MPISGKKTPPVPVPAPPGELKPFWVTTDGESARLYLGNVVEVLRGMPAKSVQCVVTSPPYWGLRQYLFEGAVVLKDGLTDVERKYVFSELTRLGVSPE